MMILEPWVFSVTMAELKFCVMHDGESASKSKDDKTYFVLHLAEQFFLSHIVQSEVLPNTGNQFALESHDGQWNVVRLGLRGNEMCVCARTRAYTHLVEQLQPSTVIGESICPQETACT